MNAFKKFLNNLFKDRYGVDDYNHGLIYLALFLTIISACSTSVNLSKVLNYIVTFLLIYSFFRMMSKNINARIQENIEYLKKTKPIRAFKDITRLRIKDRKTHRYVRCPVCKTYMRVPKNVGKIKIKCHNCGNEFMKTV